MTKHKYTPVPGEYDITCSCGKGATEHVCPHEYRRAIDELSRANENNLSCVPGSPTLAYADDARLFGLTFRQIATLAAAIGVVERDLNMAFRKPSPEVQRILEMEERDE